MGSIRSVLYVSDNLLQIPEGNADLQSIRLVALARNSELDLTGVLIATSSHFVQYLEGDTDAVEAVMQSIYADPRHTNIIIADLPEIKSRMFPNWKMACFGPSAVVRRHVQRLVAHHPKPLTQAQSLAAISFMKKLVHDATEKLPAFPSNSLEH